jgi:hypothetical protein
MDGMNNYSDMKRASVISCSVWLLCLLFIIAVTGCIPTIGLNDWPVPADYSIYLPPSEKDDVLLVSLYDLGKGGCPWIDDAQIITYPYDKAHLGMTGNLGLTSVTWAYGLYRSRVAIMLFTRQHQIIYIPLRPYFAMDDALSFFYVMDHPPLRDEDFCTYKKNDECVYFNCIGSPDYFPVTITKPDTQYPWHTIEDAKLAQQFWKESTIDSTHLPVSSMWKLHSIFGKTGQVLSSRRVIPPVKSSRAKISK